MKVQNSHPFLSIAAYKRKLVTINRWFRQCTKHFWLLHKNNSFIPIKIDFFHAQSYLANNSFFT